MSPNNNRTFLRLRKKFPEFIYEDFTADVRDNVLYLEYHFVMGEHSFRPRLSIPLYNWSVKPLEAGLIRNLAFHIGMVEMISYWKSTCSPNIIIKPYRLTAEQENWWKKLFYQGLGEFLYVNQIKTTEENLLSFSSDFQRRPVIGGYRLKHSTGLIIPVGGGKDSLVSLSLMGKVKNDTLALAINPGKATLDSVKAAGYEDNFFQINRTLDPLLLSLNKKGFLNGHTPFSALVAFVSILTAAITGNSLIALSNESSANEPTIPGTNINHQYSKSVEFEKDFRNYVLKYITPDIHYFSLLRPLNELQIASLFARNPSFYKVFRSCNVGSKSNSWCCNCPKCLFTFIMLSCFIPDYIMKEIFGENLLEKESLLPLLEQLSGLASEKPFECIGTVDEVNSALRELSKNYTHIRLPVLLKHHFDRTREIVFSPVKEQIKSWDANHHLTPDFEQLLKQALGISAESNT
jgi:UDP-N-acetyl-alpha-D-muramoyl-L-alanyl-L-glutamate epimerase